MTRKQQGSKRIDTAPPGLMRYATTTDWMPDRDGDGVVDPWDCVPWDPDQQGILGDAVAEARRIVSPHVSRAQRAYAGARSGVGRVIRRTYQTSRRVGATVARHSPSMRQTRAAIGYARAPVRELKKDYRYVTGRGATERYVTEGRGYRSEVIMKHPTLLGDIKKVVRPVTSLIPAAAPTFIDMSVGERMAAVSRGERRFAAEHIESAPTMSQYSMNIRENTARVAKVARGFEKPIDQQVRDAERFLGMHSEKIPSSVRWAGEQAKGLGYGIAFHGPAAMVEMGGMIPGGVETIAKKPSIVVPAATYGLYTMGKGIFEGITQRPGQTVGEFIAMGAISKGTPKIPVPKKVTSLLPRIELLSKDVVPAEFAKLSPAKQLKYKAGVAVLKGVHRTTGDIAKPLDFTKIKALPGRSGPIVEQWIRTHPKQKPIIGGSASTTTQITRSRVPGDVDIHVETPKLATEQLYKALKPELKKGVRVKEGGIGIETRDPKTGEWHHAIDVLEAYPTSEIIIPGLEWTTRPPPIEIGGIRYATIGEQMMRKASQTLQIAPAKRHTVELGPGMAERPVRRGEVILGPKPGRVHKDVYDFMDTGAQLIAKEQASAAASNLLLRGYRTRKAAKTGEAMKTFEMRGYMYPDPIPAIRGYYALPRAIRTPGYVVAAVGAATRYPRAPKYPTPTTTKYPKIVAPKYPKIVAPKYPKIVAPKYPPPTTIKYPPPTTKYPPPTTKYPPPTTIKYPPPTTKYPPPTTKYPPPTTKRTQTPKYPPPTTKQPPPTGKSKKQKQKAKAKEERVFTGDPMKHVLVTLESFAGSVSTTKKAKLSPTNIV